MLAAGPTTLVGAKTGMTPVPAEKMGMLEMAVAGGMLPMVPVMLKGARALVRDVPGAMATAGEVVVMEGVAAALGCVVIEGEWERNAVCMECSSVFARPLIDASMADCTERVIKLVSATTEATVVLGDAVVVVAVVVPTNADVDVVDIFSFLALCLAQIWSFAQNKLQPRGCLLDSSPSNPPAPPPLHCLIGWHAREVCPVNHNLIVLNIMSTVTKWEVNGQRGQIGAWHINAHALY